MERRTVFRSENVNSHINNMITDKNSPPKADAGGDKILSLPISVLILNGSKSYDDFRIVSWKWTRSGLGLASGTIILDSDTQSVLMVSEY